MKLVFAVIPVIILALISCKTNGEPASSEAETGTNGALDFVRGMGIGMNIGNTLDSVSIDRVIGETGWGNPLIAHDFIKAMKVHGYKTIRLPVTWSDYIGPAPDYTIDETWMARVEEVIGWILDEDLFAILNLHHDGGDWNPKYGNPKLWIKNAGRPGMEEETVEKFTLVWKQIAERFRDAHDKLILESMNEVGFDDLWNRYGSAPSVNNEAFRIFNRLNQVFVDTVRASGSNNANRYLMAAGYWTDIDDSSRSAFKMPVDTVPDRLILSVHYYSPSVFCILEEDAGWGKLQKDWGSAQDRNYLAGQFNKLKTNFINKGIPVIIGEYGANGKNKNEGARVRWMEAVVEKCLENGVCPVAWDTGGDISRYAPFGLSGDFQAVFDLARKPGY